MSDKEAQQSPRPRGLRGIGSKDRLCLGDCEFSLVSYVTLGELCNLPVPEFS